MVEGVFVSLISSLRSFSISQITLPINVECCYVHCRAITISPFFRKRDWSTPTADSSPSDSTFLITVYLLSSQQAFKIRLLAQTPTESLGTSAHCEQQDPGVPLICIWCQDENTDGLWISLPWADCNGRKIRLHRCILTNVLIEMIARSGPEGLPWPGLICTCTQGLLPTNPGCSVEGQEQ